MADRTLFFGLPLAAEQTPFVESLRGYVLRLALLHSLAPVAFLELLLQKYALVSDQGDLRAIVQRWQMHGSSQIGAQLLENMQRATGMRLESSTLARFQALARTHLVHPRPGRYCPTCVREEPNPEKQVGPLLWEVQGVECCPKHKVLLRDRMTCGAHALPPLWFERRPQISGVCSNCGSIGFECIPEEPVAASAIQVWIAESVGRLVAVSVEQSKGMTAQALRAGLMDLVKTCYAGSPVRAGKESGMSSSNFSIWLNGKGQPSLRMLLDVCQRTGADLVSLCEGRFRAVPSPKAAHKLVRRVYARTATGCSEIERALTEAAGQEVPPSRAQLARQLGINPHLISRRFREQSDRLVLAGELHRARSRQTIFENAVEQYTSIAVALETEGALVTRSKLLQRSGRAAFDVSSLRGRALELVYRKFRPDLVKRGVTGASG